MKKKKKKFSIEGQVGIHQNCGLALGGGWGLHGDLVELKKEETKTGREKKNNGHWRTVEKKDKHLLSQGQKT